MNYINTTIKTFFKLSATCLLLLIFTACSQEESMGQLRELENKYDELANKLNEEYKTREKQVTELTDQEIKKISSIEYKVIEFDLTDDSAHMEEVLNDLGAERWNCYHMEKQTIEEKTVLKTFCKRLTASHLRMLTGVSKFLPF